MSSLSLLQRTIENNKEITLEQVLNDEDYIDEIKIKDTILEK